MNGSEYMQSLCFDVGGTFIKYGIFNDQDKIIEKGKIKTDLTSIEAFYSSIIKVVEVNLNSQLMAVGISFPGFVNTITGVPIRAGAIGILDGHDISKEINDRLSHRIPIFIENDAKCAAMAEKLGGNAVGNKEFVVITLGTGVGGGIFINDEVVHGHDYRAGELGMMITDYSNSKYATLHDLASTSSLVKRYAKIKHISAEEVSGETIMEHADEPAIRAIIEEWCHFVAIAIFNVVSILNPELVLIGGGISQNKKVMAFIKQALEDIPFWVDFRTKLNTCFYYNDAGLVGAQYLIKSNINK